MKTLSMPQRMGRVLNMEAPKQETSHNAEPGLLVGAAQYDLTNYILTAEVEHVDASRA